MNSSDSIRLVRQWKMLTTLSSRHYGMTVREMAQEFGVGQRTISRDISLLKSIGFPLKESVGERGRKTWGMSSNNIPALSFNWQEAFSLFVGRVLVQQLAGTPFFDGAHAAYNKIKATFSETTLDYLEKMASEFLQTNIGHSDYTRQKEVVDTLVMAVEDRKHVIATYRSLRATEPVEYVLYPYGLVWHKGSLYLVAFSVSHDEERLFKVDRFEEVECNNLTFNKPAEFDLRGHFENTFGVYRGDGEHRIRVRFDAVVARYVQESNWHTSQQLKPQNDGSVVAEFRLGSLEEIEKWLLSFGRHAQVLEPRELRDSLCRHARELLAFYDETSTEEPNSAKVRSNGRNDGPAGRKGRTSHGRAKTPK